QLLVVLFQDLRRQVSSFFREDNSGKTLQHLKKRSKVRAFLFFERLSDKRVLVYTIFHAALVTQPAERVYLFHGQAGSIRDVEMCIFSKLLRQLFNNLYFFVSGHVFLCQMPAIELLSIVIPGLMVDERVILLK